MLVSARVLACGGIVAWGMKCGISSDLGPLKVGTRSSMLHTQATNEPFRTAKGADGATSHHVSMIRWHHILNPGLRATGAQACKHAGRMNPKTSSSSFSASRHTGVFGMAESWLRGPPPTDTTASGVLCKDRRSCFQGGCHPNCLCGLRYLIDAFSPLAQGVSARNRKGWLILLYCNFANHRFRVGLVC